MSFLTEEDGNMTVAGMKKEVFLDLVDRLSRCKVNVTETEMKQFLLLLKDEDVRVCFTPSLLFMADSLAPKVEETLFSKPKGT